MELFLYLYLWILTLGIAAYFAYRYLSLRAEIPQYVQREFERWRQQPEARIREESYKIARWEAQVGLERWRQQVMVGVSLGGDRRSLRLIRALASSARAAPLHSAPRFSRPNRLWGI